MIFTFLLKSIRLFALIFFIFTLAFAQLSDEMTSERDMGPEPILDWKKINRLIVFYTNIHRVTYGLPPLINDPLLKKAAIWQAEYCQQIGNLTHEAYQSDMRDLSDRLNFFKANYGAAGENLTVVFSHNTENISFRYGSDEKGAYKIFFKKVFWRNERQIAYQMLDSWMHSPGHRRNILTPAFRSVGAGIDSGKYKTTPSYYGAQVFSDYFDSKLDFNQVKVSQKPDLSFAVTYSGTFRLSVIMIDEDNEPVFYPLEKNSVSGFFFKKPEASQKQFFLILHDLESEQIYPIYFFK